MNRPKAEPEVALTADLKGLGCPYGPDDHRTRPWLDGFRAGVRRGGDVAAQALIDEMRGR